MKTTTSFFLYSVLAVVLSFAMVSCHDHDDDIIQTIDIKDISTIELDSDEATGVTFSFKTNYEDAKATTSAGWILNFTFDNKSAVYTDGYVEYTYTFDVAANTGEDNSGTIVITSGTKTESVNVSQAGGYVPDPEPLALSQVLYATTMRREGGVNRIMLKLATEDVVLMASDWGPYYAGNGNYLSVDLISDDPALAAGTYTPADNETAITGNYIKGYDTIVDWGFGPMEMFNWGSCWFTLENDEESGVHIENGDIVVEKAGAVYTITVNNGDIFAQYVGEIKFAR